jgi:hypothetical protein
MPCPGILRAGIAQPDDQLYRRHGGKWPRVPDVKGRCVRN